MNLLLQIVLLVIVIQATTFVSCKETLIERDGEEPCDIDLIKEVIENEIGMVVPGVSSRLSVPLQNLKVLLKSQLRKLLVYVRGKAEDIQSVGDSFHKGGNANLQSGGDGGSDGKQREASPQNINAFPQDFLTHLDEIGRRVEEAVSNSTFRVEEAVKEVTENFSLMLNVAFSEVMQKMLKISNRLEAIEQSMECSREKPDHY